MERRRVRTGVPRVYPIPERGGCRLVHVFGGDSSALSPLRVQTDHYVARIMCSRRGTCLFSLLLL